MGSTGLGLGDFGEVEIVDFHGGDDHFEGFFAGGADDGAEQLGIIEHFDEGLVEAEVADGATDPSILNEEEARGGSSTKLRRSPPRRTPVLGSRSVSGYRVYVEAAQRMRRQTKWVLDSGAA